MLGVTRQALAPLLRSFARDGLLRWRYGCVTLLDAGRLGELARADVEIDPAVDRAARRPRNRVPNLK